MPRTWNLVSLSLTVLFLFTLTSCGGREAPSGTQAATPKVTGRVQRPPEAPKVKKEAPDFTLVNIAGGNLTLSAYRGKVVLLDFWATWCPPCKKEIPHFIELYDTYGDQGLEVIGVSLDQGGQQVVEGFADEYSIDYPLVMADGEIAAAYGGIRGIPTTFLIDRKGMIVQKFVGYRDKEVFESAIKPLL